MSPNDPLAGPRASRRGHHAAPSGDAARVDLSREVRPRPVVAAATVVSALALALASVTGSYLVLVGVLVVIALLVAAGLPRLAALEQPSASRLVLGATAVALGVSVGVRDRDPHLELAPVAISVGIVLACLAPLVSPRVRAQLTPWLATTVCGIGLLSCGFVLVAVVGGGSAPLLVPAVAVAVSAVVDLALERPRLAAWMLPASMVVGGLAGLATELVSSGRVLVWAFLVGLLAAGVALSLRRVLSQQRAVDEALGGVAAGAASLLVTGPVVLTLVRAFLG